MPEEISTSHYRNQGALHSPERVRSFFSAIAPRYDLANHLLSGGCDFLWRRITARTVQGWNPERILDLATGSGDLARSLQQACPTAQIIGADFCHPMLTRAREKGIPHLVVADALHLPFASDSFDVVTIAFGLRNMAAWRDALQEVLRVLRPGGRLCVLDFSQPSFPLGSIYHVYLHRVLPTVAGWITGERNAYTYLADSIAAFPQGAELCSLLESAGYTRAQARPLQGGIVTLYTAERPSRNPRSA